VGKEKSHSAKVGRQPKVSLASRWETTAWCRNHLHEPIVEQHRLLSVKLRGHYSYYGITGNYRSLHRFKQETECIWRKWLNRRSLTCDALGTLF
jgi:hypothetical protein